MTQPKNPTATEQTEPLPGLDDPAGPLGPMELATRRTLTALAADGLLGERHAMVAQLLLDLAKVVTVSTRTGKASAAAMAAAQILAAYAVLVPEMEGGDPDAYDQLADELRNAAMDAARSAAAARDGARPE